MTFFRRAHREKILWIIFFHPVFPKKNFSLSMDDNDSCGDSFVEGEYIVGTHLYVYRDAVRVRGDACMLFGDFIVAIGNNMTVWGNNCVIFGDYTQVMGDHCTVVGRFTQFVGRDAMLVGDGVVIFDSMQSHPLACQLTPHGKRPKMPPLAKHPQRLIRSNTITPCPPPLPLHPSLLRGIAAPIDAPRSPITLPLSPLPASTDSEDGYGSPIPPASPISEAATNVATRRSKRAHAVELDRKVRQRVAARAQQQHAINA